MEKGRVTWVAVLFFVIPFEMRFSQSVFLFHCCDSLECSFPLFDEEDFPPSWHRISGKCVMSLLYIHETMASTVDGRATWISRGAMLSTGG